MDPTPTIAPTDEGLGPQILRSALLTTTIPEEGPAPGQRGEKHIKYTNIQEIGDALTDEQAALFFSGASDVTRSSGGWLVGLFSHQRMFDPEVYLGQLHKQFLNMAFNASTLVEARYLVQKFVAAHPILGKCDFVALPANQVVAVPFHLLDEDDLIETIDKVTTSTKWVYDGSNAPGCDEDDDSQQEKALGLAQSIIHECESSLPKNRPIIIKRGSRGTLGEKAWNRILDYLRANEDIIPSGNVSCMYSIHIGDLPGRVYLLGETLSKNLLKLYESTIDHVPYVLQFVRFGRLHHKVEGTTPEDDPLIKMYNSEFNRHITLAEYLAGTWGRFPFEDYEAASFEYVDEMQKKMMGSVVERNPDLIVGEEGQSSTRQGRFGHVVTTDFVRDSDGRVVRAFRKATAEETAKFVSNEEKLSVDFRGKSIDCVKLVQDIFASIVGEAETETSETETVTKDDKSVAETKPEPKTTYKTFAEYASQKRKQFSQV